MKTAKIANCYGGLWIIVEDIDINDGTAHAITEDEVILIKQACEDYLNDKAKND